ncbi:TRAP transporter large permease [Nocardioides insulae]|uniref:TRAP transporter large permease n=1 Tax=Nocardioides insulae TaxID=394734 RepID=UPI0003FB9C0B|nr:TRAP transporter large permease [Nocardioides insulae]
MIALLFTVLLLALIMLRVPVSFAVLSTGILGLLYLGTATQTIGVLETAPPSAVMSYTLSAAPLFIFMAQLILLSGLVDSLFDAARALMGRVRCGTAVASVAAGTAFAAVSGSSTASAATLASTSTAQLIDDGYEPRTAGGLIAVVGTLAAMIPPSVILVFYAITAEVSVGDTIVAAVFPGLLVALVLVGTLYLVVGLRPHAAPRGAAASWQDKGLAVVAALPILVLFAAVVGSIYTGLATATEAAGIGCVAAFLLALARGRVTWMGVKVAVVETVKTSAMIFAIIIGAEVFGHFLTETRVTEGLVEWIGRMSLPAFVIMLFIGAIYVVLGFFMDQIAIIALTVPITLPMVTELGYDPIWFGIFIVLLAEVGMVTPPMGLNVFVVARVTRRPAGEIFRGALPFAVAIVALGVVLLAFPDLVLWSLG